MSTMGLAFIATLSAHWATDAAVLATLKPCNAVTTALMTLAALNTAKPVPMPTRAALMGSAFALTQSLNAVSLSATSPTMPAAPLKASPNAVPAPAAPPIESSRGVNWPMRSPAAPARLLHDSQTAAKISLAACAGPVFWNAVRKSETFCFAVSNVLAAVSRMVSRKSTTGLSSSTLNASRSSALKSPSRTSLMTPCRPVIALPLNALTLSAATLMAEVTVGLNRLNASVRPPTTAASRLPMAPSMVEVLVAASLATSLMPRSMIAAENSSAVISPFSMASLKLPVYAPALSMDSWSRPAAPGMASVSWFQFSVVSLPAPAVWVMTMATLLNVSALPPATAFRLPAASVRPT